MLLEFERKFSIVERHQLIRMFYGTIRIDFVLVNLQDSDRKYPGAQDLLGTENSLMPVQKFFSEQTLLRGSHHRLQTGLRSTAQAKTIQ